MVMTFGLVASGLTVYDPKAASFAILVLLVLSMSLPAFYLSYMSGYYRGRYLSQVELLAKMREVIELVNEVEEVSLGVDDAFGDIKSLEILEKLEAEG